MSAAVYFSPVITPEKVLDMFKLVDKTLPGNIAIKLHSGEKGNQNFLGPEFWKPVIDYVGGTVVECNTAYGGARNTTEKHRKLMDEHGWSRYFTVDLLDAEGPDMQLDIPGGKVIKKIVEETGVKIDIEDDGRVMIMSNDAEASAKAVKIIEDLTAEVEVGRTYLGKVVRITDFGAFVEVLPGKDGLVHISQLALERVKKVEDVVKVGDEIMVKCVEIDKQGRVNLSRKVLLSKEDK